MAYQIIGGCPLVGSVRAQGSKNAALPILYAVLLTEEPVILSGLPDIGDIRKTLSLLSSMGVTIEKKDEKIVLCAKDAHPPSPFSPEIGEMRASSYLLGAGLFRFSDICIAYPGGCNLGERPLNLHRDAFAFLGAAWTESEGLIRVSAQGLRGTRMLFSFPSVGATVNVLLAALAAEGTTEIYGYAKESHVMCFLRFLKALGADLAITPQKITVRGKQSLHGASFRIDSDEIEVATYLIACAAVGGEVTVENAPARALSPLFDAFDHLGVVYHKEGNSVTVWGTHLAERVSILCAPCPAFPTDLHPPMAVLLSCSAGGKITDCVWRDRFSYVAELSKMGFIAQRKKNTLRIQKSKWQGAKVCATDLRGGAAMVLAALCADGESLVENTHYIERGYESFLRKLSSLGANIKEK